MLPRVIIYIMGIITGHCYGEKVYTNKCGTVTVAEPAIDGKRVLFTFVPKNQADVSEGDVEWRYYDYIDDKEYEAKHPEDYTINAYNSSLTLDLSCSKSLNRRRTYSVVYYNSSGGCRSSWIHLTVLDAPTNCGILYRQPKKIQNTDEVIMEYYAPDSVLKNGQYVRHLRRKTSAGCDDVIGCAVDVTWFEEDYSEYNSKYVYRIRNFTDDMNGNYTLQCTNRTHATKFTNYVRLVIPVAPHMTTFLNTKDIDGHENCIVVKEHKDITVRCDVEGGSYPMYVHISIVNFNGIKECTMFKDNELCEWRLRLSKDYHLLGIQCEVSNEATVQPIVTTANVYVVIRPTDPYLYDFQQTEGDDKDIECRVRGGQPTPKLSMLVNDKEINSSHIPEESSYWRIKFNHLNRNWNGAALKCCMQHLYYDETRCSDYKQVKYQFSPESTNIHILTTERSDRNTFTQTLQCAVINANPACNVNWTYPSNLQVVIGAVNVSKPPGQGGFTTTSTIQFNGTQLINSQDIYCQPVCGLFSVTSMAKYNILIPYGPDITTNASKDTIWNVGDTVMITCYADSFPLAKLSWFDTDHNTMATLNCGEKAKCMEIKNVQMTDAGIYTCIAETELFETVIQSFELAFRSTRNATTQRRNKEKTTIPWFVVGLAASLVMVLIAVIIAVVIFTKRGKRRQIKKAPENVSMEVIDQNSNHCSENIGSDIDTYDSIQDVTNANRTGNTIPSNADSPSTDDGSMYDVVIPKPQRQTEGLRNIDTGSTIKQDNHNLVHANLDLITTTKKSVHVPSNELTKEYVSMDFNRTGEQLPDAEAENMYANQ